MSLSHGMVMTSGNPTEQLRSREDVLAEIRAKVAAEAPRRITEAEAQERFVSLASKIADNWEEAHRLAEGLDREWPEAMMDNLLAPTLAFWLFGTAETVREYLGEALESAWAVTTETEESVRSGWEERFGVESGKIVAELLLDDAEFDEVTAEVRTRILPEVEEVLNGVKKRLLSARGRLPQHYPELSEGKPSRAAVLHGDLGILVGALEEALARVETAATGVEQE